MSLLVTGTIGIDTVATPTAHRERILGGSAAYFAAAAGHFAPVRMVAAVGGDFPADHMAALRELKNVDLTGLEVRKESKTFAWGGKYFANMNQRETLFTELGVLAEPPPKVPHSFADSRYLFLANTHPEVQLGMLGQVKGRRLTVVDTMDLWIKIARAELMTLLQQVDGVVLNYEEAEQLTGINSTVAAGKKILSFGPRFVVVKKGEHGALLVHRDGLAALPAFPTDNVVDPTGAGDSFAGGMMGSIAAQGEIKDPGSFDAIRRAIVFGTVTASFTIESFSLDRLRTLQRPEIMARLDEYTGMVRV
ncbi:MAG TPA: PfkB family carbohydrate kinase [Phycisphaerales bacterium]|nr:PfkB family carbohydrate kinase [Phycisphaerales bacterium]